MKKERYHITNELENVLLIETHLHPDGRATTADLLPAAENLKPFESEDRSWPDTVRHALIGLVEIGLLSNPFGAGNNQTSEQKAVRAQWVREYRPDQQADQQVWQIQSAGIERIRQLSDSEREHVLSACDERLIEGGIKSIEVYSYSRNYNARALCILKYGYDCSVCKMNFKERYGVIGRDFIHVHHLTALSDIGKKHEVNPFQDLRPVCPNCHAMLHANGQPMSIQRLKKLMDEARSEN